VPHKLNELMDSENAAAAVRASLALENMAQQSRGEPTRKLSLGGIVVVLNQPAALPGQTQAPMTIEHAPRLLEAADDE
jgi:hypothetical protein